MSKVHSTILLSLSSLLLSACLPSPKNHPDLHPSLPQNLSSFHYNSSPSSNPPSNPNPIPQPTTLPWFDAFHDPTLSSLVNDALHSNLDLKLAAAKAKEAHIIASYSSGSLFPFANFSASTKKSQFPSPNSSFITTGSSSQIAFESSWTLDIWQSQSHSNKALYLNFLQALETQNFTQLSIIANVTSYYINFRFLQLQSLTLQHQISLASQILSLQQSIESAGIANQSLSLSYSSQIQSLKTSLSQIQANLHNQQLALETLLNKKPGSLSSSLLSSPPSVPSFPHQIILDSPLHILQNRPDVLAHERSLLASTHLKKSAISQIFPSISLSGLWGLLRQPNSPQSDTWSYGISLSLPIFNWSSIQSNIKASSAREEQAFLSYQKTIASALQEIESNLIAYHHSNQQFLNASSTYSNASQQFNIDKLKFDAQITSSIPFLTSSLNLNNALLSKLQAQQSLYNSFINLIKSLAISHIQLPPQSPHLLPL